MLTVAAAIGQPLDPHALTELHGRQLRVLCDGDDLADAFVSADERRRPLDGPVTPTEVEIGVADPGADHLDETLAECELGGLGDADVVLHHHGLLGSGDDGGELRLGDVVGHGWKARERFEGHCLI